MLLALYVPHRLSLAIEYRIDFIWIRFWLAQSFLLVPLHLVEILVLILELSILVWQLQFRILKFVDFLLRCRRD